MWFLTVGADYTLLWHQQQALTPQRARATPGLFGGIDRSQG